MRLLFTGGQVDWITKTRMPRTLSWISTDISLSEKSEIFAFPSGILRNRKFPGTSLGWRTRQRS